MSLQTDMCTVTLWEVRTVLYLGRPRDEEMLCRLPTWLLLPRALVPGLEDFTREHWVLNC